MKNIYVEKIGEYQDFNDIGGVLLLTEVFIYKLFRKTSIKELKLDPVSNLTHSFIIIMRSCSKTVELLTDLDMILDYENGAKKVVTRVIRQ